ncbi:MAG: ABC transporter permease, partial [Fimbriimonadaceae bacterium]|nr:ABC transporter permease [Alphaproteobacteria bacterium]
MNGLVLAFRLALRELRGGLRGFYVFLACLTLGVAAIAGVGSVSEALLNGLEREGQNILGGDISFDLTNRRASDDERGYLAARGDISEVATLRAMARATDNDAQTLVEIKAIDSAYPLYSGISLAGATGLDAALTPRNGRNGVAVEQILLDRLALEIGDELRIGEMNFQIRAVIEREPDRLSGGFSFGPRAMIYADSLDATGLVRPGSLVHWRYRMRLPASARDAADLAVLEDDVLTALPDAGWHTHNRLNANPRLANAIGRFTQILTLIGLTSLIVGGVGVANAVRAHLEEKKSVIAILKCLGAQSQTIFQIYLIQVFMLAALGTLLGIVLGAMMPLVAGAALAGVLPFDQAAGLHPGSLGLAAAYGLLVALAFSLWPVARACEVPAASLFRDMVARARQWPKMRYIVAAGLLILTIGGLAVMTSSDNKLSVMFIVSSACALVLLRLVASGIVFLARRAPRLQSPGARMALANIHRPGALTASVVLSLGLGLTLMVALALIDGNLTRQLNASIPGQAPNFYFLDIQRSEMPEFRSLVSGISPDSDVRSVAMLRGRIVSLDGVRAEDIEAPSDKRWALNGDRGITYADDLPEGSTIVAGEWWPADYAGEPLVSFEAELGEAFGLSLGDPITVNVLGREITARIASFRKVEWQSLAINFVLVFSPNTFSGAPHMMLATVTVPEDTPDRGLPVEREV